MGITPPNVNTGISNNGFNANNSNVSSSCSFKKFIRASLSFTISPRSPKIPFISTFLFFSINIPESTGSFILLYFSVILICKTIITKHLNIPILRNIIVVKMKSKIIVGFVIFGIVFSAVSIDFEDVKAEEEVKFRGTVVGLDDDNLIDDEYSYLVKITEILKGNSILHIEEKIRVEIFIFPDCYGHVDYDLNIGDKVEVYGLYEEYYTGFGGVDVLECINICPSSSYYIKKIGSGCPDGFLWIHCNEYEYDLYVDGSYRLTEGHGSGKSTSSKPDGICGVKLSAGDHTITLEKDGCDSVTKTVHIGCGEEKTIYVNMECDPCKNKNCDQYDGYIGDYYCKNGDVYRKYRDYYCEDGKCKYREEERKIEDCEYGCEDGGCIIDPCKNKNCDQYDGYVGEKYCKNGNVYQKYRDYYCDKGECKYREEERKIEECKAGCENGECVPMPPGGVVTAIIHISQKNYGIATVRADSKDGEWHYFRSTFLFSKLESLYTIPCTDRYTVTSGGYGIPKEALYQPIHFEIYVNNNEGTESYKTEFDLNLKNFEGNSLNLEIRVDKNSNKLIVSSSIHISIPESNDLIMEVDGPNGSFWNWIPFRKKTFDYKITLENNTENKEIAITNIGVDLPTEKVKVDDIEITYRPEEDMFIKDIRELEKFILEGDPRNIKSWLQGASIVLKEYKKSTGENNNDLLNVLIKTIQILSVLHRYDNGIYWAEPYCSFDDNTGFIVLKPHDKVTFKITIKERHKIGDNGIEPYFYATYLEAEKVVEIEGLETLQHWINFMLAYEWDKITSNDIGVVYKKGAKIFK